MVKKTDNEENTLFEGTITVVSSDSSLEYGGGDIEMEGTLSVDTIQQNTDNIGVTLESTMFNDGFHDIPNITAPVNPQVNKFRFFENSGLYKSLDNVGKLTTYQPTNIKGDITVHGPLTQERLPVGIQGQVLTVDFVSSRGVKWTNVPGGDISQKTTIGLFNSERTSVVNKYHGSFFIHVYPFTQNGGTCSIISSKSRANMTGSYVKLNNNLSLTNLGTIESEWPLYKELLLYKNYVESQGEYSTMNNNTFTENYVTLTGVSWIPLPVNIYGVTTGVFFISIFSRVEGGAAASFFICKNNSALTTAAISKLSSSPGNSIENLELRWTAGNGIEVRKNISGNDLQYVVFDNHQFEKLSSVTLTGTAFTDIPVSTFRFYTNKSLAVKIENDVVGAPKAIILLSKNSNTYSGNTTIFQVKGITTEEAITVTWSTNQLLKIKKSGVNYDGVYRIGITSIS